MSDFKLSATFEGHGNDVRAVVFPRPNTVASASRDASVRVWNLDTLDSTIASQGDGFINSLTYLPPTPLDPDNPAGLVFAGASNALIEGRSLDIKPGEDPAATARMLIGHAGNVCALDTSANGEWIVSGSWDSSAIIWKVGKWECERILEGHQGSVWAVISYDNKTVITGCADKTIRIFDVSGKLIKAIPGSTDVIRALCKLPESSSSGAQFASAGNDSIIHLWTLDGLEVAKLHGHESFIYSLACSPSGEIVSSGEDRTVRVWKDNACIQTITHPAISVWSVAVNPQSEDIVSGASDRMVRVFSRSKDRQADTESIQRFEGSVKESAIPQQQVGNINKDELPGPDFLTRRSGTKDGQVQMILENNGSITAHTWSSSAQQWVSVGTVVDSAGSGTKTEYQGQDYDYVFDVDIEDGKPPLKLPYNLTDNAHEVAQNFIANNHLPRSYIDQVTQFIITNTQGATIGSAAPTHEPTGTSTAPVAPPPKVLPQKSYLSIKTANLKVITNKINDINSRLKSAGSKDLALSDPEQDAIKSLCEELEKPLPFETSAIDAKIATSIVLRMATSWPVGDRIPGLDLLRLLAADSPVTPTVKYEGDDLITALLSSDIFTTPSHTNNIMLSIRTLANLFGTEEGRKLVIKHLKEVIDATSTILSGTSGITPNRNLTIAVTTLYINIAVYLTLSAAESHTRDTDSALRVIGVLCKDILPEANDSEVVYRALVAEGTLLDQVLQGEAGKSAQDKFDVEALLGKISGNPTLGREPRITNMIREIRQFLH